MAREIELKARVRDLAVVRTQLLTLGARLTSPREFEENLIVDAASRPLRAAGHALRVRQVGGRALLTFKGPKQTVDGIRSREELELRCDDGATLITLLERIGFTTVFRYQKYRETWRLDDVEVMLDETPIGTYLEIEGSDAGVRAAARRLEIADADVEPETYPSLFRQALDARGDHCSAMVFDGG